MKTKLEEAAINSIGYSTDFFDGEDWVKVEWFKTGAEWQEQQNQLIKEQRDELLIYLEDAAETLEEAGYTVTPNLYIERKSKK